VTLTNRIEAKARAVEAETGLLMCRLCGHLWKTEAGRMVHGHLAHGARIERVSAGGRS
jgi:hypothetical protein